MPNQTPGPLPPIDRDVLERTAKLLHARRVDFAKMVDAMEPERVALVEARAVVATLRTMMLDVTFDDSYSPGDVAELSELFELWRGLLNRDKE
jgi:hypothetical protein